MARFGFIISIIFIFAFCTPKGPQTFDSEFIGKTKGQLIRQKGPANKIKIFDQAEAYIYIKREEYYGKNTKNLEQAKPKHSYQIEYIYYINPQGIVYKYQVWKKRIQ